MHLISVVITEIESGYFPLALFLSYRLKASIIHECVHGPFTCIYIYASWTFISVRIYREKEKYIRKKTFFFGSLVYRVMRVSEEQKK
jgi:hypothetical protein